MGSETSRVKGLEINEKAVEITDFWGHYRATIQDQASFFNLKGYGSVSIFKSEAVVPGSIWSRQSPLQKCSDNLIKYRHPHIIRYLWHWSSKGTYCLATEPVQPLSQVLSSQESLQLCIGLHQILQALEFLHDKTSQSHNNINISSIYVTPEGSWKLAGMEFLKPFDSLNSSYLKQIKKYRYDSAIDPNEESSDDLKKTDMYAFCVLVEDVFKGRNDDDVPHLKRFKQYCKEKLQNPTQSLRPTFNNILQHDFFNHEFISIHKFLSALPIKSELEKKEFFSSLLDKLLSFNEETVAKQLSGSLLSRLVLLNSAAREKMLPCLLTPKDTSTSNSKGLFTLSVFKHHITPQLLRMFRVRDMQVRLLLLKYFSCYMRTFSEQELTAHILPELLLGIKDTDDILVSMTLYCLADLIPILGASTVIGAKRSKIFTDGRPMIHTKLDNAIISSCRNKDIPVCEITTEKIQQNPSVEMHINTSSLIDNSLVYQSNSFGSKESLEIRNNPYLHERPSPDGGEDLNNEIIQNLDESDGNWSDWEDNENKQALNHNKSPVRSYEVTNLEQNSTYNDIENVSNNRTEEIEKLVYKKQDQSFLENAAMTAKLKKLADITELDIKSQKFTSPSNATRKQKDEIDFFTDMEPVIEKANTLNINAMESSTLLETKKNNTHLSFALLENDEVKIGNDAWGDVNWDDD